MTDLPTQSKLVTIFGGSGFLGRYAVRELANRGWRVRAAVRRPDLAGHLQPMGLPGQIMPIQANLRYRESVAAAVAGAEAVVNLVGSFDASGRQSMANLHHKGAESVARAARDAGITQVVQMSAIGADPGSAARYGRTKAAGETSVLNTIPEAVILRPSIVFGPEDEFFNRFAGMATMAPALPLIGGGKTRFQPVYVGDVGEAIANAVEGKATPGTTYELGGPEIASFRTLLERTLEWSGRSRELISLPFFMAKGIALASWPLPSALRPMTLDQVTMLKSDNVVSDIAKKDGRTLAGLGIKRPTAMAAIVPHYLERFRPRGQFARYRG